MEVGAVAQQRARRVGREVVEVVQRRGPLLGEAAPLAHGDPRERPRLAVRRQAEQPREQPRDGALDAVVVLVLAQRGGDEGHRAGVDGGLPAAVGGGAAPLDEAREHPAAVGLHLGVAVQPAHGGEQQRDRARLDGHLLARLGLQLDTGGAIGSVDGESGPGMVPGWDYVNPRAPYDEYMYSPYQNFKSAYS